ncbi:MAG: methyltransferase domain-containing protein [Gemmatimonadota bacterium]|nr:methyltransferase domain-containing protein [Gemmatimonadota bacterium]
MLRSLNLRLLAPLGLLALSAQMVPVAALQIGGRPAEEWAVVLESGRRLGSLEVDEVVSRMGIRPGDVVADVGAGTGVFSVSLARATGPTGAVLAVEVDAGFLPMIAQKGVDGGVGNIQTVLGEFTDPKLPRRDLDVAFFHDVIHHIEGRQAYLQATAQYMGPGSRVVVVDYHGDRPGAPHSGQPEMLITLGQVREWMSVAGFDLTQEFDLFDDKFFVVFTKRD